jgi:hypothetical protein
VLLELDLTDGGGGHMDEIAKERNLRDRFREALRHGGPAVEQTVDHWIKRLQQSETLKTEYWKNERNFE